MKILAAVDRSEFADAVVGMTLQVAAGKDVQVLLLHVAPREPDLLGQQLKRKVISDPVPAELRDRRELLDRLAQRLSEAGAPTETLLIRGSAGPTIAAEAQRWGADLIIVGSHGRSMFYRKFMGSVSEQVLQYRESPVLVVFGPAKSEQG